MKTLKTLLFASLMVIAGTTLAEEIHQIQLTPKLVQQFINSQPDLAKLAEEIYRGDGRRSPEMQAKLENAARKHGFRNFEHLDDTAGSISIVLAGMDANGVYTDLVENYKREIESVRNDASIPKEDRDQLIEELTEAIANTQTPLPGNVDVVRPFRQKILEALN